MRSIIRVFAMLFFTFQVIIAQETLVMEEHDANADGLVAEMTEKGRVSRQVTEMINGIRRLEYSYDFDNTCVSSFRDCIDDSNCDSDEECFFSTSRRKRKLEANAAVDEKRATGSRGGKNLRSLLFGTNNVGQCECI